MSGLHDWLATLSDSQHFIYVKRLSANDTGATGAHQAGPYIPKSICQTLFPSLSAGGARNPEVLLTAHISSHDSPDREIRAIYYNEKLSGKKNGRNEIRITRWGRGSPLLDTENTGALALLAFEHTPGTDSRYLDIWVCVSPDEEDIIESVLGEVVPGTLVAGPAGEILGGLALSRGPAGRRYVIPEAWQQRFPSGSEIIGYAAGHYAKKADDPDTQLIERRRVEYDIFLLIEEIHVLDVIRQGFGSVDEFIALANSVSNRRKSRAGRSLELHLEQLFTEHGLHHFATQAVTEGKKKPDFLFPSARAYHDAAFPEEKLRMLAVKTTCKDRWRQILSEADRIGTVHLFTLQEGVSPSQFREMQLAGVRLVVPASLHSRYPAAIRGELMTLGDFIAELIGLYDGHPAAETARRDDTKANQD